MQVKFGLKMVLECWDREFLGTTTIFQKNNISWPQQPPTEKVLNFNMIFHDSTPHKSFSKHQNEDEFKNLDDSEVLSSDFSGPRTSAASLSSSASATSLASTASKALFHQKTSCSKWLVHPWHQNVQYWPLFVKWLIKNPIFYWYLILFLIEAVEASRCYFFEKWLWYPKIPYLSIPEPSLNPI